MATESKKKRQVDKKKRRKEKQKRIAAHGPVGPSVDMSLKNK